MSPRLSKSYQVTHKLMGQKRSLRCPPMSHNDKKLIGGGQLNLFSRNMERFSVRAVWQPVCQPRA